MTGPANLRFEFPRDTLRGRVLLLAGGSGGLGAATAVLAAAEGARLVIGYRSKRARAEQLQESLAERYGSSIELVEGEIAREAVRRRYLSAAAGLGPLYGLVCFSGSPARVDWKTARAGDLAASLEANYSGPVLLARDAARQMQQEKQSGAIVLLSTMQAVALFEGSTNYAGPKAALILAARILAREVGGPDGVRVNVVAPGVNRAGMALASIESGKYDRFVQEGIIPRFGRAEDVARVVRLLLEPDNYVTGQVITVDGGLTLRR